MSLPPPQIEAALRVIEATPGYQKIAAELRKLASKGRIRANEKLEDRAQAGLLGTMTIGPEALESSPVSLAQTLVHELYHLRQNPLEKTISFWSGVWKHAPVMQRYERPAYQAALDFLEAVKHSQPQLSDEVEAERTAIRHVFQISFHAKLD